MKTYFGVVLIFILAAITACGGSGGANSSDRSGDPLSMPPALKSWTDMTRLLVKSDGSYSLGDPSASFNGTRDQGSKIVFFDVVKGDNSTADYYWWNGTQLIDSTGSATDANGAGYGSDPLHPNENAIKAFASWTSTEIDDGRLVTQQSYESDFRSSGAAGGYPDWFLFKRGQTHTEFNVTIYGNRSKAMMQGGRSEDEPMVVAAYGAESAGRAIIGPSTVSGRSPFIGNMYNETVWLHMFFRSLEMKNGFGGGGDRDSSNPAGGPTTAWFEDCRFDGLNGGAFVYSPKKTTLYRTIVRFGWLPDDKGHNQGYFQAGYDTRTTFEDTVFYKNGFAEDPKTNISAKSTIFSRNVYQGGGAKMGHVYRNFISAHGGSGGPQMRYGGLIEDSLVVEGYWYTSTVSDKRTNDWLFEDGTVGQSAVVRNNLQFLYRLDTPNEPMNSATDGRAHPGWGFILQGATHGGEIEGNIISGAMLENNLGGVGVKGLAIIFDPKPYTNGQSYYQTNNTVQNNILYKVGSTGISIEGDATGASNNVVKNNVIISTQVAARYGTVTNLTSANQLQLSDNRFYFDGDLPSESAGFDSSNTVAPYDSAATNESWGDPERTVKRYVTEALGLTLLDWADDPWLDAQQVADAIAAGDEYDPMGVKTFMAVATNMRLGGTNSAPTSGKPNWTGDYEWNEKFTAKAVNEWVRAGFGL